MYIEMARGCLTVGVVEIFMKEDQDMSLGLLPIPPVLSYVRIIKKSLKFELRIAVRSVPCSPCLQVVMLGGGKFNGHHIQEDGYHQSGVAANPPLFYITQSK